MVSEHCTACSTNYVAHSNHSHVESDLSFENSSTNCFSSPAIGQHCGRTSAGDMVLDHSNSVVTANRTIATQAVDTRRRILFNAPRRLQSGSRSSLLSVRCLATINGFRVHRSDISSKDSWTSHSLHTVT